MSYKIKNDGKLHFPKEVSENPTMCEDQQMDVDKCMNCLDSTFHHKNGETVYEFQVSVFLSMVNSFQ